MKPLILAEPGTIDPKDIQRLENDGYLVIEKMTLGHVDVLLPPASNSMLREVCPNEIQEDAFGKH